jgi:mRNA-degrading endonuclease RelE of RelBE toxin-antitoxin system
MNETEKIRSILYTDEFKEFYNSLDERTKDKYAECLKILESVYVLSTKFVKKLVGIDENLYELRVSVGYNEYRSMLFSANHDNIIQATEVFVLSGFLKKSTKDYDKQIKKAIKILNSLEL